MKTKDYEEKIALKLKGLDLLEDAVAGHLKNNLDSICDMHCQDEWTCGRNRKCQTECSKCEVLTREEKFLAEIKQYELEDFIGMYCGLFCSDLTKNKYRPLNQKITLEDKVFALLSDIAKAKQYLSELGKNEFINCNRYLEMLGFDSFDDISDSNTLFVTDTKCFPIKSTNRTLFLNMETGEIYVLHLGFPSQKYFYVLSIPKLYLFDYGERNLHCNYNRETICDLIPITPHDIKQIKSFGEDDYKKIIAKAKDQLQKGSHHSDVFIINIENISYGKIQPEYSDIIPPFPVAVLTDKNGNNIMVASEIEIASTKDTFSPSDPGYFNVFERYKNIFFNIKSSELIGSTLIAEFYACKGKIYAEPISVLTEENLIHLIC
jgi:hypothetical protein